MSGRAPRSDSPHCRMRPEAVHTLRQDEGPYTVWSTTPYGKPQVHRDATVAAVEAVPV